jgi:glucan biosynthesis protein
MKETSADCFIFIVSIYYITIIRIIAKTTGARCTEIKYAPEYVDYDDSNFVLVWKKEEDS